MVQWLSDNAWWLIVASTVMLLGGIVVSSVLALIMPADHFPRPRLRSDLAGRHVVLRIPARVVKNVAGAASTQAQGRGAAVLRRGKSVRLHEQFVQELRKVAVYRPVAVSCSFKP